MWCERVSYPSWVGNEALGVVRIPVMRKEKKANLRERGRERKSTHYVPGQYDGDARVRSTQRIYVFKVYL